MDLQSDLFTLPLHRHHHTLDQLPNDRLAVCSRGGLGIPQGRQITRETANGFALACRQGDRLRGQKPAIVRFEPLLVR
jgi:hypothetical protein